MQKQTTLMSLSDPLLYEQFEKDLKFLQLFLLLVNNSSPIKRVDLVWAEDGPAGRVGLRKDYLSTEKALIGPCAHMLASAQAFEPVFCNIVSDYGRHEVESCGLSDKAAEARVRKTGKPEVYRCHAGLIDIAVPVICEGQYIATLFTGQVLSEAPSHSGLVQIQKQTAGLTYIDAKRLENAYFRVPVVSESDIQRTIQVLEVFAEYLATTWMRLSEVVRDQQRRHREANLERKEFAHLILEGNLTDRPLLRELMGRIGFTRYPNCVMVVRFDSEGEHQSSATFDLNFARALHAVEELCEGLQNVCCTYLRSQGICIFFGDRERVEGSRPPCEAELLASKVLRTISANTEFRARIGVGAPKSNWWYLADAYHEACTALAGSSSQIAIYRSLAMPDEELSVAVGRICRTITEKQILNSRLSVLGLPLLVNRKIGDRSEALVAQRHFFSYVLDAIRFAVRQLGTDGYDVGALEENDKAGVENATSIFAVQEAFIRSAECILDSVRRLLAGRPRKLADRVRSIIERELQERSSAQTISIGKIASGLGISAGHLSRVFKRTTGVTLERYLMILKIESAKRLLLDPLENVSDAAEKCGFSDSAYFARVFRKIAGCSPREYRDDPMRARVTQHNAPVAESFLSLSNRSQISNEPRH